MLHVIIDTSIYRNDPKRGKPAFEHSARLCEAGKSRCVRQVKGDYPSNRIA